MGQDVPRDRFLDGLTIQGHSHAGVLDDLGHPLDLVRHGPSEGVRAGALTEALRRSAGCMDDRLPGWLGCRVQRRIANQHFVGPLRVTRSARAVCPHGGRPSTLDGPAQH